MRDNQLVIRVSVPQMALYMLAVIFVLEMRSVWTSITRFNRVNEILILAMVAVATLFILSRKQYTRHFINGIITSAVLCGYMFVYYFYDQYIYGAYSRLILRTILRMCVVCLLCFAMTEEHKRRLFEMIENVIVVIAVVSLVFWLTGSVMGIIHPNGIEYTVWSIDGSEVAINKYYNIYFETQTQNFFGVRIVRNSAIFVESPMSSFMFCYGFLIELFKKKKTDVKKMAILTVAVLTTFSTTGYIVVIVALFIRYLLTRSHNQLTAVLRMAVIPVVLIAVIIVVEQLLETKMDSTSGSARMDDFVAGFKAWMDHPLMGNGFSNNSAILQYMSTYRIKNTGFSNSLMQILSYGGLYLLAPYVGAAVYGIYKIMRKRDWNELAFTVLFIVMFVFTVTSFQMLSIFTFFSIV